MGRPSNGDETRSIHGSVLLTPSLQERIRVYAKLDERTLTWVMSKAIELGMAELERKARVDDRYPGS